MAGSPCDQEGASAFLAMWSKAGEVFGAGQPKAVSEVVLAQPVGMALPFLT